MGPCNNDRKNMQQKVILHACKDRRSVRDYLLKTVISVQEIRVTESLLLMHEYYAVSIYILKS
jgi:hypothetical protein